MEKVQTALDKVRAGLDNVGNIAKTANDKLASSTDGVINTTSNVNRLIDINGQKISEARAKNLNLKAENFSPLFFLTSIDIDIYSLFSKQKLKKD